MPSDSSPIRWSAYEHDHIDRGSDWFWALGITATATAVTSVLFGNILFAILILVAATTLGLLAKQHPPIVEFELSGDGVRVGEVLHSYGEIISFWVDDVTDNTPTLLIDTTKFMSPNLVIPLGDADPSLVRALLSEYVPEIPMKEPLAHKILEFFGL